MEDILQQIESKRDAYKAIPFWSWNHELKDEESDRQIKMMHEANAGGFFMHSRSGLLTEYLSDEFLEHSKHCAKTAHKYGMEAWAYDEFGWPSGFAAGVVPAMGYEYQQKAIEFLTLQEGQELPERVEGIYRKTAEGYVKVETPQTGDLVAYIDLNLYYIDVLNKESITRFIEVTHEKYAKVFGDGMGSLLTGFFTDEPQWANGRTPYSPCLAAAYQAQYSRDITQDLYLLEVEESGFKTFRYRYFLLAAQLFQNGFLKQIYNWCDAHNCKMTGHMMAEDDLMSQMRCTGGVMPHYPYFHIPGMDWLCRRIDHPTVPLQVSSACAQLGKPFALTETFALCGWDVSFEELKWIAGWQYVNGINRMCQHLQPYSLQGFRKRDFPPAMFYQSAWFTRYDAFNRYFDRIAAAMSLGTGRADLVLIHPIRSAYCLWNVHHEALSYPLMDQFRRLTERLNTLQIEHHFGDETLLETLGSVDGDAFVVGKCRYHKVLLPGNLTLTETTYRLLVQFVQQGGKLYYFGEFPTMIDGVEDHRLTDLAGKAELLSNPHLENTNLNPLHAPEVAAFRKALANTTDELRLRDLQGQDSQITLRGRDLPDGSQVWCLANLSQTIGNRLELTRDGSFAFHRLDLERNISVPLQSTVTDGSSRLEYTLEPMELLVLQLVPGAPYTVPAPKNQRLTPSDQWTVAKRDTNCMPLDFCRYRVDGGEWQFTSDIVMVNQQLLELQRPCKLELEYTFQIENVDAVSQMELAMESPENSEILLNGKPYTFLDTGYYLDTAFRRSSLDGYLVSGTNTLLFRTEFFQRQQVYDVLFGENVHETERNKLTYDTELEAIYVLGNFGVRNNSTYRYGPRRSIFCGRDFTLMEPIDAVDGRNLTESGYWFFRGEMELTQTLSLTKETDVRYTLELASLHVPAASLMINGKEVALMAFSPFRYDITDALRDGDNEIRVKLYCSNRNLLGPFHRQDGECYDVSPWTYICPDGRYEDGYTLVRAGLEWKA